MIQNNDNIQSSNFNLLSRRWMKLYCQSMQDPPSPQRCGGRTREIPETAKAPSPMWIVQKSQYIQPNQWTLFVSGLPCVSALNGLPGPWVNHDKDCITREEAANGLNLVSGTKPKLPHFADHRRLYLGSWSVIELEQWGVLVGIDEVELEPPVETVRFCPFFHQLDSSCRCEK